MIFQIVDILSDDTENHTEDNCIKAFQVTLYGKTKEDKSIVCTLSGFRPYFYCKIPKRWNKTSVNRFMNINKEKDELGVNNHVGRVRDNFGFYDPTIDLLRIDVIDSTELYGFRCDSQGNRTKTKFAKLTFSSNKAMKVYSDTLTKIYSTVKRSMKDNHFEDKYDSPVFKEWVKISSEEDNCDSNLYESNIHPIIRFIHDTTIEPCNWVELDDFTPSEASKSDLFPNEDMILTDIDYTRLRRVEHDSISKFKIASFDIECDSSHGDFPLAIKDFKKLAIDIYDGISRLHNKFNKGQDEIHNHLKILLNCSFNDISREVYQTEYGIDINKVYTVNNENPCKKSVKDFVDGVKELTDLLDAKQRDKTINEINKLLNKLRDNSNRLIQVEGDKVIQIGTVFHKYGDDERNMKRHILVIAPEDDLDDDQICSPLPGIEVVCCKCEKDLLLEWMKTINNEDPDYITGYNTFGFDFGYMIDRMKVYCCGKSRCQSSCPYKQFFDMGKINMKKLADNLSKKCKEVKKKTSNFGALDYDRYIHMDGRIIYDLKKEIEKGHNLESYKLDNVAAHFMRGKITGIKSVKRKGVGSKTRIYTTEFGNLKEGDYISLRLHSNIGETYYENNKKYMIKQLRKNDVEPNIYIENYMKFDNVDKENTKTISTWSPKTSEFFKIEWCLMKDDVSPQDIFKKHKEGPDARAEVAKYCIQDCELCINLTMALDIIPNNIAMANVCTVPQSYIYLRGQGAKIFSLISRECAKKNIRIPTLKRPFNVHDYKKFYKQHGREATKQQIIDDGNWFKPWVFEDILDEISNPPPREGYEGAIVLDPVPGIYLDDPVGVVDYASLYPRSIIEKNISHDTLIEDEEILKNPNVEYESITYTNYVYKEEEGKATITKEVCKDKPEVTCHYLKRKKGDPMGIIPTVVDQLLSQRNATKKRLKNEPNEFKKKVLDGLQLSYKLVANSVYGQTGAKTSPIYKPKVAASTTAVGRQRIYDAKEGVEGYQIKDSEGNDLKDENGKRITKDGWWDSPFENGGVNLGVVEAPEVIYGDTDSVFIKWSRKRKDLTTGVVETLEGEEALKFCITCGQAAGSWITTHRLNLDFDEGLENGVIKKWCEPQDLEYEKTFYPFILLSKKRYVADKYEFESGPGKCKRNSMGIVLKRRDNAPIVKHVFGNVIEKIMIDKDLNKSVEWLKQTLADIREGKFHMNNFVITKSLRGYYKNPGGIAHKVLADRIAERDPGNKPKAGDRMPFAYRVLDDDMLYDYKNRYKSGPRKGKPKLKKVLQGDRVEDPEYIKKNNLSIDYEFYITNQIMNPVKQVLDLELDSEITEKIFLK